MKATQKRQGPILKVRFDGPCLLEAAPWDEIHALRRRGAALIVLDLQDAQFVSTVFLESCVELARCAAECGRAVAVLNASPHHRRVLELVQGRAALAVLQDEEELQRRAAELLVAPAEGRAEKGVSSAEKMLLWS